MSKPPDILSSDIAKAMNEFYNKCIEKAPLLTGEQFNVIHNFRTRLKPLSWENIVIFMETELKVKLSENTWQKRYFKELKKRRVLDDKV